MKKQILFFAFSFFLLSIFCAKEPQITTINGSIQNVADKSLKIDEQDVSIDEDGSFKYQLELEKPIYVTFDLGEATLLFIEPGDSLHVKLDANQFLETINISGTAEEINQFLVKEALESKKVNDYFNSNYQKIFILEENDYIEHTDSLRNIFENLLNNFIKEKKKVNEYFIETHKAMLFYGWSDLLIRYPNWYRQFSGKDDYEPSEQFNQYLNLLNLNNSDFLHLDEYQSFLKNYVDIKAEEELKKNPIYSDKNHKIFRAKFDLISNTFVDPEVKNEMLFYVMEPFLAEYNTKGMEDLIENYRQNCSNQEYLDKIEKMIQDDKDIKNQCEIQIFKTVDDITLDAFIYKPADSNPGEKQAALAFFHGGGWDCGKPEWGHLQCDHFSKLGMVCISFQYRLRSQHNATPVEGIADAKSAIRWMREHADEFGIDPDKIVASGFSAGGHLAACTAMIDKFDEPTEDLTISSAANALILWVPAVKIIADGWFQQILEGKATVSECDPCSYIKPKQPPAIIFQGTADDQVPVWTVKEFDKKMRAAGNRCELNIYEGQIHLNWGKNNKDVLQKMDNFLISLGYLEK